VPHLTLSGAVGSFKTPKAMAPTPSYSTLSTSLPHKPRPRGSAILPPGHMERLTVSLREDMCRNVNGWAYR
jgi:hypothetical protein